MKNPGLRCRFCGAPTRVVLIAHDDQIDVTRRERICISRKCAKADTSFEVWQDTPIEWVPVEQPT